MKNRIIIALDGISEKEALRVAEIIRKAKISKKEWNEF